MNVLSATSSAAHTFESSRWQFAVFRERVRPSCVVRRACGAGTEGEKGGCFTLRMQISDSALISERVLGNLWIDGRGGEGGEASVGLAALKAERMVVVVLLHGPWACRLDGRLISAQIRRVKRFCLLCGFGLIISKLDPTRRPSLTVRTSMAANAPV